MEDLANAILIAAVLVLSSVALTYVAALAVIAHAVLRPSREGVTRSFVAGLCLLPVAGLLGGMSVESASTTADDALPAVIAATAVAFVTSVGGVAVSVWAARRASERSPFASALGWVGVAVAAGLAVAAFAVAMD